MSSAQNNGSGQYSANFSCALTFSATLILGAPRVEARQQIAEGVFTATESGSPIELTAWAEPVRAVLKMAHGGLEQAPVLPRTYRFLVNVGGFEIAGVMAAHRDVFKNEIDHVEKQMLPHSAVKLSLSAVEVGVRELEDWGKVLQLRKSLRVSKNDRPVFFVVLSNGPVKRFYPFFVDRQ
jgi:hypothetical protein